jgi:hypothetical protein
MEGQASASAPQARERFTGGETAEPSNRRPFSSTFFEEWWASEASKPDEEKGRCE